MKLAELRLSLALLLAGATGLCAADAPAGFSRKVLVEQDLATAGRHGTMAVATFEPGGVTPKHTHPGEEFLYLLEGQVRLEIDGQAPRDLQPGDAVIIPANTPHLARNLGPGPARIVSSYFLEKGRPLASTVK